MGQINFSNCLPINLPIEEGRVRLDANRIEGNPQELNRLIEKGDLDISSTSSFLYLSRSDLTLVPDLSISSYGPVGSVLFFANCKPESLSGRRIAVPSSSATSIKLTALMLEMEYQSKVEIVVVDQPVIGSDSGFSGALVIGDKALQLDESWSENYLRIDLGEWWMKKFALPMVFGVFVARTEFASTRQESYRHVCLALKSAREIGTTSMLDAVIDRAREMTGLPRERMAKYFLENLNWRMDEDHLKSLDLFSSLLHQYDLI
ncbi:MAG: menaquinone biosynthesis protein [Candidatus Obscuribacterales bacterium]|nr:menaquinone biosynthesis protein [Candidatus Obscuribacterales bacterium]